MTIRKRIGAAIVASALLLISSIAGNAETTNATVTIEGIPFSTSISGGAFDDISYSFTTVQDLAATFSVTATDPRGTGTGWRVQVSATNFVGDSVANTFSIGNLSLSDPEGTVTTGGDAVSTVTANSFALSTSPQTLLSAASSGGEGDYTFTYNGALDVPGQTRADSYTSTITVTIVNGP